MKTRIGLLVMLLTLFTSSSALAVPAAELIWEVENVRVLALLDRTGDMSIDLFSGPNSPEERARYFTDGKASAGVNSFLILTGSMNILVDTGFGNLVPDDTLAESLALAGLTPADIDIVLLTHMHTDHVGGLLKNGGPAFPNASILVSQLEFDYWLDRSAPDNANANAKLVRDIVHTYAPGAFHTFELQPVHSTQQLAGIMGVRITPLGAVGHTPGHTVFRVRAAGQDLLIIGDLVHAADLQFALPDECARYDIDPAAAVAARKEIMEFAAEKKMPVAGMHIPYPGAGLVEKQDQGFRLIRK